MPDWEINYVTRAVIVRSFLIRSPLKFDGKCNVPQGVVFPLTKVKKHKLTLMSLVNIFYYTEELQFSVASDVLPVGSFTQMIYYIDIYIYI